jgi:UDP-GlcNAc:undecaprenyl-phosphate GlcNAc-1-phosphate transferase
MLLAAAFVAAFLLSLLLTPLARRLAWAVGYLDHPEARKLHVSATALLGGVGVFVSALVAWLGAHLARRAPADREALFLLAGAAVALGLGLVDDRHGMRPSVKLLGQVAAAGTLLLSGAVPDLGLPFAGNVAVTLVALVALMNAVNFLDNMNGMVAGLSAIALAAYAWTSAARGAFGVAAAQLALSGACLGFLRWNFPRARIFLGDAGSLFLGYSVGASAVLAFQHAPSGWTRLGPLLMLAYPAFDLIFVVVNRLRDGRKFYEGGRDHSNHRLASVLRCQTRTVILLWLVGAALCASGLAVLWLNRAVPTLLLSVLWTTLLVWAGARLSSVPIEPPPSTDPP